MDRIALLEGLKILKLQGIGSALVEPVDGGTAFYTIDPEKIAMVKLIFHEEFAKERAHVELGKLIKSIKTTTALDVSMKIDQKNTYIFGGRQEFTLRNIDIGSAPEPYRRPLNLPANVILETEEFHKFTRLASGRFDYFKIIIEPTELRMRSENDDGDVVELLLMADQLRQLVADKKYEAKYAISWFKEFLARTSAEYIMVEIGNNYPAKVSVEMRDYTAEMIVAPVIET